MEKIVAKVGMDETVFKDFSYFNNFKINFRASSIIFFPAFVLICSIPAFYLGDYLLGGLFLAIAFLFPLLYRAYFHRAVNRQIAANQLHVRRETYICEISDSGFYSEDYSGNDVRFSWDEIFRVYEVGKYFYFYITKTRVYIIPKADIVSSTPERLSACISQNLPQGRFIVK